jgi:uncharacterized protein YqgQ
MNLKTWEPLKNELKSIYNKRIMRKSVKCEGIIKKIEKKAKNIRKLSGKSAVFFILNPIYMCGKI